MNKDFQNAILLVQDLLAKGGLPVSALARAAALRADQPGALDVLHTLNEHHGAEVFLVKDGQGKQRSPVFDAAARGNQVETMRWMLDAGVLEKLDFSLMGDEYNPQRIRFPAALAAAEGGAYDALEFFAERVPQLKSTPLEGPPTLLSLKLEDREPCTIGTAGYTELLIAAIAVAKDAGKDVGGMVQRFSAHLQTLDSIDVFAMKFAIEADAVECVTEMLKAGGTINPGGLPDSLKVSHVPISTLRAITQHVEETKKIFEEIFSQGGDLSVRETSPYRYSDFQMRNFASTPLPKFMTGMADLYQAAQRYWGYAKHNGRRYEEFDPEILADEMVRFMKKLVPDAISPAMLARAVGRDSKPLVRRLLDEGVDPNSLPDCKEEPGEYTPQLAQNYAPIHRCYSLEMMHLLCERGADINLMGDLHPSKDGKPHPGNLLTSILQNKRVGRLPQVLETFARYGGDFGAKLGSRALSYYLSSHPEDTKQLIKSIKTQVAVEGGLLSGSDASPAAPQRNTRNISPL